MATFPFPNEKPLSIDEAIDHAENQVFSNFEDELSGTANAAGSTSQTKKDFDYSTGGHNGHILIARPKKPGAAKVWANDLANDQEWHEDASYDPAHGSVAAPGKALPATTGTAGGIGIGMCAACGNSLVPGSKFCNGCGTPVVATPAAPVAPPAIPSGAARVIPAVVHNPNRMEGRPEKEVVVPEGMKSTKHKGFEDALDKLLADAEAGVTDGDAHTSS